MGKSEYSRARVRIDCIYEHGRHVTPRPAGRPAGRAPAVSVPVAFARCRRTPPIDIGIYIYIYIYIIVENLRCRRAALTAAVIGLPSDWRVYSEDYRGRLSSTDRPTDRQQRGAARLALNGRNSDDSARADQHVAADRWFQRLCFRRLFYEDNP